MKPVMKTISVAALLAGSVFALPAMAADYVIDTKGNHASINFKIKHLGYSWLAGRFDKFSGQFSFDKASPEKSAISVEIDASSFNSNHAPRDKHVRSGDFLDVAKFPTAIFKSTSVKPGADGKAMVEGQLTLHGVTKAITINAEYIGGGKDPWGGVRQGFSGTTSFALADFGITKNLGPASKVIQLELHIEGVRK